MNSVTQHRNSSMGAQLQLKEVMTQSQRHGHSIAASSPLHLSVGEWGSDYLTVGEERKSPEQLLRPGCGGSNMLAAEVVA